MTKITMDEVIAVLRSLERRGLVESFIDTDGEVCWWFTAKATPQAMRDWQEDSRLFCRSDVSAGVVAFASVLSRAANGRAIAPRDRARTLLRHS